MKLVHELNRSKIFIYGFLMNGLSNKHPFPSRAGIFSNVDIQIIHTINIYYKVLINFLIWFHIKSEFRLKRRHASVPLNSFYYLSSFPMLKIQRLVEILL